MLVILLYVSLRFRDESCNMECSFPLHPSRVFMVASQRGLVIISIAGHHVFVMFDAVYQHFLNQNQREKYAGTDIRKLMKDDNYTKCVSARKVAT